MNLGSASALTAVEMNTHIQLCNRFRPVLVVCKAHFVYLTHTRVFLFSGYFRQLAEAVKSIGCLPSGYLGLAPSTHQIFTLPFSQVHEPMCGQLSMPISDKY